MCVLWCVGCVVWSVGLVCDVVYGVCVCVCVCSRGMRVGWYVARCFCHVVLLVRGVLCIACSVVECDVCYVMVCVVFGVLCAMRCVCYVACDVL